MGEHGVVWLHATGIGKQASRPYVSWGCRWVGSTGLASTRLRVGLGQAAGLVLLGPCQPGVSWGGLVGLR